MNPDGTQKAAEILLPPEHPTGRWAPNAPGRKKWDRSEAEQEGTGHGRCRVENEDELRILAAAAQGSGSGLCLRGLCGAHRAQPRQSCLPSSSGLKLVFFFLFSPLHLGILEGQAPRRRAQVVIFWSQQKKKKKRKILTTGTAQSRNNAWD